MSEAASKPATLRADKSFHAFTITQLLGVFNDNAFRQMILLLAVDASAGEGGGDLQAVAYAIFALPFLMFSGFAGLLSDKLSKRTIIVWMKIAEIAIMALGALAFYQRNTPFLFFVLFLMGAQSAFFGPAKYGIMPEMLREKNLARANGIIQMTTLLAIVLGGSAAGVLRDAMGEALHRPALIYAGLAVLGTITALRMRPIVPAKPSIDIRREAIGSLLPPLRSIWRDRPLLVVVLAYSYFWFLGGVLNQSMNAYGRVLMGLSNTQTSLFGVTLSGGMAVGFLVAGMLSRGRIHFGLTNWGIVGVGACFGLLSVAHQAVWMVHTTLFVLGLSGGFFALPLQTFIQWRADDEEKGRVIAGMNFTNFVFIFLSAGYYGGATLVLSQLSWIPASMATLTGVLGIVLIPRITRIARSLGWEVDLLYHWLAGLVRLSLAIYFRRVEVDGEDHIPEDKPIVFVANHPNAMIDALLIGSFYPKKIHFLAKSVLFKAPLLAAFLRTFGVIPAYRKMDKSDTGKNAASFERCFEVLAEGGVIALFPEGTSVTEPAMRELKTGAARIALGAEEHHDFGLDVHIVPVALGYDEKSVFRSRVLIHVGEAIAMASLRTKYEADPRETVRALTERLQQWFFELLPQADDWHELRFVRRVRRLYQDELRRRGMDDPKVLGPDLAVKLDMTRRFHEGYRHYREAEPHTVRALEGRVERLYQTLELVGLPPRALSLEPRGLPAATGFVLGNLTVLLLGLPVFVVGLVHNYVPYKAVGWITSWQRPGPEGASTVKLLAGLVLFPLFHGAAALAYGLMLGRIAIPISLIVTSTAGLFVLGYWHRLVRAGKGVVIWLRNRGRIRSVLERQRGEILDEIERLVREYSPATAK